jgi:hypothetical protein
MPEREEQMQAEAHDIVDDTISNALDHIIVIVNTIIMYPALSQILPQCLD